MVRSLAWFVARLLRRIGVTVAGSVLLIAGAIMLVAPGPGLLTIAAGLAVLGTEFTWAERAFRNVRGRAQRGATSAASAVRRWRA